MVEWQKTLMLTVLGCLAWGAASLAQTAPPPHTIANPIKTPVVIPKSIVIPQMPVAVKDDYNPFQLNPALPTGGTPPQPVPKSADVAPPPSFDRDPDYVKSQAYAYCMDKVLPTGGMSPVDLQATSLQFTPDKAAAIYECMKSRGITIDPARLQDTQGADSMRAGDRYDSSAYARENATRSSETRALIKKLKLEKFMPPEGSRPVAAPQAAAAAAPLSATAPAVPAPAAGVNAATQAPSTAGVSGTTDDRPARGRDVFVPSGNDSGPAPIFLH